MSEHEQEQAFKWKCQQHESMLKEIKQQVKDIHMVVCGNEQLGVDGLIEDMKTLKKWKSEIDLRTAGIAGGVCVIVFIANWIFK